MTRLGQPSWSWQPGRRAGETLARWRIASVLTLVLAACAGDGEGRHTLGDSARGPLERAQASGIDAALMVDALITPELVALGDSIFHGQVAGAICWSCHGADARGTLTIAPNLTDSVWLHNDGSYRAIAATIAAGVSKPKESSSPMPQGGGVPLSQDQLRAVAAYVYVLSHPDVAVSRK